MGKIVYEPTRNGPTLWEIGIPDRTAQQFYVPDPNPKYINKLYVNHPDRYLYYFHLFLKGFFALFFINFYCVFAHHIFC